MRPTPSPPAWCRTAEQREAWNAGFKAALQSVTTEQLSFEVPAAHEPRWGFDL